MPIALSHANETDRYDAENGVEADQDFSHGVEAPVGEEEPDNLRTTTVDRTAVFGRTIFRKHPMVGPRKRGPMGDYLPDVESGEGPLTALAIPTPSPLDYCPRIRPAGPHYSILGKLHAGPYTLLTPSPAQYEVSTPLKKILPDPPKWTIKGRSDVAAAVEQSPGPGQYHLDKAVKAFKHESITIKGKWAEQKDSGIPGPEIYDVRYEEIGTGKKFSFAGKRVEIVDPCPGPGDYTVPPVPPKAHAAPQYSMAPYIDSKVFDTREQDTHPSPNQYLPRLMWGAQAATLKGRYEESKELKTPGPANYIIHENLFSGPQFTFGPKSQEPEHDPDAEPEQKKPAKERNLPPKILPPGPTDYNPNFSPKLIANPAYSLSGRPRSFTDLRSSTFKNLPGPGQYTPRDRQVRGNGGPKVTIKGRWRDVIEQTPGPASYQTTPDITPATLKKIDSAQIRVQREKTSSKYKPVETAPGPGSYDPHDKTTHHGPMFSLGRKPAGRQTQDESPGPNTYLPEVSLRNEAKGISLKGRASPFIMVFAGGRTATL
ncbi:hypothetical protein HDU85_000702 [Gaertneriomyces sp. JEL0708]|nr:hypothetical protein HDU85_000702 [Gaertneriomyces sp. JEL0708]